MAPCEVLGHNIYILHSGYNFMKFEVKVGDLAHTYIKFHCKRYTLVCLAQQPSYEICAWYWSTSDWILYLCRTIIESWYKWKITLPYTRANVRCQSFGICRMSPESLNSVQTRICIHTFSIHILMNQSLWYCEKPGNDTHQLV